MTVIGLKTLSLNGQISGMAHKSLPIPAMRKRVFTDDEWAFLNGQPTEDLLNRIQIGDHLIGLLYRPEMINMTQAQADMISSNLRFQQEAIRGIITRRGKHG